MTPKRIRLIATVVRQGILAHTASTEAMAQELEDHATELEQASRGTRREPGTVFDELREQAGRKH